MHWLVRGAQPGDALFFHYSGHGGQAKATQGDEADGMNEVSALALLTVGAIASH